jgi:chromosome segregation ATPase
MTQSPDHETRISRLEVRIEEVAADATAARHLAAARDRDLAELTVKVDANRKAINALGEQTRARFDQLDAHLAELRAGQAEVRAGHEELRAAMRHGFDQTAAGFARIAELISARDDQ